jgi:hypothetical protein
MTIDTRTPAEIAYDNLKSGAAYVKPSSLLLATADYIEEIELAREADRLLAEQDPDRCCPNGTPKRDCPACTAKFEAERQQIHARAAAAETATERVEILLDNHEVPDGDQIFDLLLEDQIAHYVWARCIDWVLWRQAHNKPVKRCGDEDDCPATIDARYDMARAFAADIRNYSPTADVALACAGELIEKWERTPEQEDEIRRTNELLCKILEVIDGGE